MFRRVSVQNRFLSQVCVVLLLGASVAVGAEELETLTLDEVLTVAKTQDFRLQQFKKQQQRFTTQSEGASYLPDPVIFAGMQNLPVDTFALDQEPMTNIRLGVRQMFPKGDSLELKEDAALLRSEIQGQQAELYWLERKKIIEQTWYDALFWQRRLELLEEDKAFIEQTRDFIQSLYEVGARTQADLIGAELELIKLKESRIEAQQRYDLFRQKLDLLSNYTHRSISLGDLAPVKGLELDRLLLLKPQKDKFVSHPGVRIHETNVALSNAQVSLLEQEFEPAWGLELSYGLRDGENPDGSDRPDFFSAGISVAVPFMSSARQTADMKAEQHNMASIALQRDERALSMYYGFLSEQQQLKRTVEQRSLYREEILPTLAEQRKTAQQAYESDKGSFQLVINIFLKEQAARVMIARLMTDEHKLASGINYYLSEYETDKQGAN